MEPQRVIIHAAKRSMAPEQRAGLIFVVVAGSLTSILGLFFVLKHVSSPFLMTYEGPVFETTAQKQAKEIEAQKTADTDGDGLTDYNELYVYKTSAYLADTDGDGYSDQTEITGGTNPNCPTGATCETLAAPSNTTSPSFVSDLSQPVDTSGLTGASTTDQMEALKNMTVAQIRQLLVQSGADQATIDSMTDEQVQALYDSALAQLNSGTGTTPVTTTP